MKREFLQNLKVGDQPLSKEVKASEIDYADEDQSYLFSAVRNIENITPADATAIIRDYDPASGLSVGEYLNGIDEGFTYGYYGYSQADLKMGNFAPKLGDTLAKSAYVLGQNARKSSIESQEAIYKKMRTAAQAAGVDTAGKVTYHNSTTVEPSYTDNESYQPEQVLLKDGGIQNGAEQEYQSTQAVYGGRDTGITETQIGARSEDGNRSEVSEEVGENESRARKVLPGLKNKASLFSDEDYVDPQIGSELHNAVKEFRDEYGIECRIVKASSWPLNNPAHVNGGVVYVSEDINGETLATLVPHEVAHVMKQRGFKPYLDFVQITSEFLNKPSSQAQDLLLIAAEHCGLDIFALNDIQYVRLYDELNAIVYGLKKGGILDDSTFEFGDWMPDAFYDFDGYISKLDSIYLQFREQQKTSQVTAGMEKAAELNARQGENNVEVYFQDGKSVVKFDEHTGKYDDKRMAAVNTAKFLSKMGIGGKYYFFESYVNDDGVRVYKDADGNEVEAPNGIYKDADGSIHIDLNAGDAGQGTALFTMGHELGHFVKAQSERQFKILSDLITEAFDKTDMSMHERVLAKQKFLEDKRGKAVSYDEAFEEVVCDALSTMLTDGSFHEKIMEIKVKDKGLFNTIKRFFDKMIAKFRKVYEKLTPDQRDAQDIRQMKDMFDRIQTAFAEALVEASENFQVAAGQKNTTKDGGVKYSLVVKRTNGEQKLVDPLSVTTDEVLNYLMLSRRGLLDEKCYFPVRLHTPGKIIATLRSAGIEVDDKPLAMQASKAKQSQQTGSPSTINGYVIRKHSMTPEEIMEVIDKLDEPETIIQETERVQKKVVDGEEVIVPRPDAFVVFVTLDSGKECVAVLEFDSTIDPRYIIKDGHGDEYHTTITVFEPDVMRKGRPFDYQEFLVLKDTNFELDIKEESSETETASGEMLTTESAKELSSNRVTQPETEVKSESAESMDVELDAKTESVAPAVLKRERTGDSVSNRSLLANALVEASDNFQAAQTQKNTTEDGGVKNQARENTDIPYTLYRKLLNKKSIKATRKDWAKVSDARVIEYRGLSDYEIPDIDFFQIAEYKEVDKGYVYTVRNYDKDSFEMIGKNRIKNRYDGYVMEVSNNGETGQGDSIRDAEKGSDGGGYADSDRVSGNEGTLRENVGRSEESKELESFDSAKSSNTHNGQRTVNDSGQIELSDRIRFSQRRYNKEVDDIVHSDDNAPFEYRNVFMGETPQALLDIGFIQLPMTITSKHIYTIANKDGRFVGEDDHYHNLGANRVMELPELLKKPVATFVEKGNPRRVVIVTSKVDASKKPIMVSVEYSGQTRYKTATNEVQIFANPVTTALGKKDSWFASQIEDAIRDGRMLQADKKRSQESPSGVWSQCPESLWSSDFTTNIEQFKQNVKRFLPKEKQIRKSWGAVKESEETTKKSDRGDGTSNRDLLANAFEGITKGSAEHKLIQEYKNRIKLLNEQEVKLSKLNAEIRKIQFGTTGARDTARLAQLEAEAKNTAKAISRHDKKLLSLEASEPLRKVIERERKKEAKKTKDHVKEIQQNKKVRAEQTELRHKIRKAIRDLDKILNRGNKKQNVKEDVQKVVSTALKAADILFTDNYGTYDMLRNGIGTDLSDDEEALVKTCAQMLKGLDKMPTDGYENWQARQEAENMLRTKMSKLKEVFARERKRLNNTTVSSILGELADAYASLEKSDQSYVQGAYTEAVHNFLKNLQSEVGGTIVKDMTKNQLESVYAAYKMVLNTVRNANKMFNEELKQSREQLGNAVIEEVLKAGGVHLLGTKMGDAVSQFDWNNMKPIWVGNRIGSETFGKLMNGLFKGQYNFAVDIDEVKQFKLSMDEKYHPRNWDAEKQYEFESSTGKKFSLDLQQIMSLYAFSKREQAYNHLLNGGFVFEDNSTVIVDEKGRKKTYIHKGATAYKLNEATLNGIINSLTTEQKAYVDEMQKYLSDVMGAKGNEVSMQLYGIKMFKEQFYFPLRSSGAYMERAKEAEMKKQQGQINLVNSGFTHSVKPEAKNPIILAGFMDVWAEHCNEMSMYHAMVLPMEDFRKVYNYSTIHDEKMESASVFQTIQDAYGKAATNYIDQLYRELNAGATVDPRETPWKKLISNFKKSAVMLSGSVVVQQFSSIGRAYAIIDPKYFIGTKVNSDTSLSVVEEMKKYAPVAIIKEMGGFDTGTKGSAISYITAEKYGKGERIKGFLKDKQYRDDIMGFMPQWADQKTWCAIWEATKRETKAKHSDMDVKSEEFLKLAGERFSEIIEKTQVYDSVLARSANMRSKGGLMQMATAFMAEPTTTVNLIEDAIRSGNAKHIARAFGSVAVSIVLNNALASIVYAMRDDDEDETFIEKYFQSFTSGMIDDINPMTYYPFLKDVWSLFQGYDVERADMSAIADVRDALKQAYTLLSKDTSNLDDNELAEHNKSIWGALMSVLDAGCSAFGVPVKNVRRDAMGIINAFSTIGKDLSGERDNSWLSFWDKVGAAAKDTIPIYAWTKDKAKTDKLYDAIVSGDEAYLGRLKSTYKTEDAYQSAVRKALREHDPRIKAAAQARYDGNTEEYKRIFREIQKEGKFTFDDIMSAINTELSKLTPDKVTSDYTASGYVEAIAMGNTSEAQVMKNDIIATKVANGKTWEEAEKEFASSVATGIREAYTSGLLDETGAEKMLLEYAGKNEEEAASKVSYWAFCEENPKYDYLSESNVNDYYEFAEPADISVDVYAQFINGTKGLTGIKDEWGDVEVTKRAQVLEVIDFLPLAWQQKDALYLTAGYSESKIWDVPW